VQVGQGKKVVSTWGCKHPSSRYEFNLGKGRSQETGHERLLTGELVCKDDHETPTQWKRKKVWVKKKAPPSKAWDQKRHTGGKTGKDLFTRALLCSRRGERLQPKGDGQGDVHTNRGGQVPEGGNQITNSRRHSSEDKGTGTANIAHSRAAGELIGDPTDSTSRQTLIVCPDC